MAKPEPVGAVWHDGSDAQLALVTEWVLKVERDREVRFGIEPGKVLVIRPAWPSEPVRLRPGMYLVRRSAGWTGYSSEQFQASFEPCPVSFRSSTTERSRDGRTPSALFPLEAAARSRDDTARRDPHQPGPEVLPHPPGSAVSKAPGLVPHRPDHRWKGRQ